MAFKEMVDGGEFEKFKFEKEGDVLTGYYLGDDTINVNGKEILRHLFQRKDGVKVSTLSQYKLDELLAKATPGNLIEATYTGKKKTKNGGGMKNYKVRVDSDDTIPVVGRASRSAPPPTVASNTAAAIADLKRT